MNTGNISRISLGMCSNENANWIKRKTAAVVVCDFEVFSRVLNFIVISSEHNYFRIKFKFSWFSEFHSNNKVYCTFFEKIHCPNSWVLTFPSFMARPTISDPGSFALWRSFAVLSTSKIAVLVTLTSRWPPISLARELCTCHSQTSACFRICFRMHRRNDPKTTV